MTIWELGRKIKQQYPQYEQMADFEVGKSILRKYPQYRKQITVEEIRPEVTEEKLRTKGILGKVGEFVGVEKLGRRIGAGLATLSPEHRKIVEKMSPEQQRLIATGGISLKQALGGVALTGLTLALPFAGKLIKPATASFKSLLGRGALTGAAFGAAGAVEEGMEFDDIRNAAMLGSVVGLAFPSLSRAMEGAGGFLKGVPRRMYNTAFKSNRDVLERELRSEARGVPRLTTAEWALTKEKIVGGFESMAKETIRRIDTVESSIKRSVLASKVPIQIDKKMFLPPLQQVQKRYAGATFSRTGLDAQRLITAIKKSPTEGITQRNALDLKRFLDKLRSRPSFKLDQQLTPIQEDIKIAADTVRNALKQANPTVARELNREKFLIEMFDSLVSEAVKTRNNKLLNLTDILLGGGGMATGMIGGGIGAAAAVRGFQQAGIQTRLAQTLQKSINFQNKIAQGRIPMGLGKVGEEMAKSTRQVYFGAIGQ